MQIRPGSLLIAHPVHSDIKYTEHVVYITESSPMNTSGLTLNHLSHHDLRKLMEHHGVEWPIDNTVYIGGPVNTGALVMLHSDDWYSSNTMQIDKNLSMSSDDLMIKKLGMGNVPEWYRLFLGCESWDAEDIEHQLKKAKPEWLLLANPSQALIELSDKSLWHHAVAEYSQDVFDTYF